MNQQTAALVTDVRDGEHIVWVSEAFEHLTLFPAEVILGKTCKFLQGRYTSKTTLKKMHNSIVKREPLMVEILNYRLDGSPFINGLKLFPLGKHLILSIQTHYKFLENLLEREVEEWTAMEVAVWIEKRHFAPSVVASFLDNNIAGKELAAMSVGRLTELGITSPFDQDRLLNFVEIEVGFRKSMEAETMKMERLGKKLAWTSEHGTDSEDESDSESVELSDPEQSSTNPNRIRIPLQIPHAWK